MPQLYRLVFEKMPSIIQEIVKDIFDLDAYYVIDEKLSNMSPTTTVISISTYDTGDGTYIPNTNWVNVNWIEPCEEETMPLKTKDEKETKPVETTVKDAQIVVGDTAQIILPKGMTEDEAIIWLQRKKEANARVVGVHVDIPGYPLDGALAFHRAIAELYGFVDHVPTPGFFGPKPPVMVNIDTSVTTREQVPWGRVELPNIKGYLSTSICWTPPEHFVISGEVQQGDMPKVKAIIEHTMKVVHERSIYKGKAIKLSFEWEREGLDFDPTVHCPKFMDMGAIDAQDLILSESVSGLLNMGLFWPIKHAEAMRLASVPLKRSVLLYGKPGVGKTLTAYATALLAVECGWTFIYLDNVYDLKRGLAFARQYAPAVLFSEDIDRHLSGARTEKMDSVLNAMDGVDSKESEIITVFTTNYIETINKAILRPGRNDLVVEVLPPDAQAAERLVRKYGRGLINPATDISSVGTVLAGFIPAIIREIVERSKICAIARNPALTDLSDTVRAQDLLSAADMMKSHIALLDAKPKKAFSRGTELLVRLDADNVDAQNMMEAFGIMTNATPVLEDSVG